MQMTHANGGRMAGGGQRGRLPSLQTGKKLKKNKRKKIKAQPVLRWRIKSVEIRATYRKFEFHTFQGAFGGIKAKLVQRK